MKKNNLQKKEKQENQKQMMNEINAEVTVNARDKEWWDRWFLGLAEYVSTASKDPSTQVGAVIKDEKNRIVSMGYNGMPRGISDTVERLHNRELKYKVIIHAERNALLFADTSLDGCTIYTHPFAPCTVCAGLIIQSGITRVVSLKNDNPRWIEDIKISTELFAEAGVEFALY
jgi:dCMP deaminase